MNQPGFYVLGQCTCSKGISANQPLWVSRGFGTFFLGEVSSTSKCTTCKKKLKIIDIGIYNCHYKIKGRLLIKPKQDFSEQSTVERGIMKTFDQGPISFIWEYLKIETTKS